MNTTINKLTKKELRVIKLNAHYNALESIARTCGIVNPNGKKLSIQLLKLERAAYKISLDYCNSDNNVTTETVDTFADPIKAQVRELFNNNLKGFKFNYDARGCALKINDVQFKEYYNESGLTRDWGGNGMLSPDID